MMTQLYTLPNSNHKAKVLIANNEKTLFSYDTKILTIKQDGTLVKHWDGWSLTTGKHVSEFLGYKLTKQEFLSL